MLSIPQRLPLEKRSKDVLYIHDTIQLFSDQLEALQAPAAALLAGLPDPIQQRFHEDRDTLFNQYSAYAAKIAQDSGRPTPPSPAAIRAVCREGLEVIFGAA